MGVALFVDLGGLAILQPLEYEGVFPEHAQGGDQLDGGVNAELFGATRDGAGQLAAGGVQRALGVVADGGNVLQAFLSGVKAALFFCGAQLLALGVVPGCGAGAPVPAPGVVIPGLAGTLGPQPFGVLVNAVGFLKGAIRAQQAERFEAGVPARRFVWLALPDATLDCRR